MAWITLTEPNGNPVRLSGDQLVRIRVPLGGGDAPAAAKAIVDLTNGQNQAVKENPDSIIAQLNGGVAQAVGLAGPMIAPMKKAARRLKK
jgi:hypothetical protein